MSKKSTKKSSNDIISLIFNQLNENPKNVSELSNSIHSYHSTVREYAELIDYIQSQPRIKLAKTGSSYEISISKKINPLQTRCPYCFDINSQVMVGFDAGGHTYQCPNCHRKYLMKPSELK